MPEDVKPESPKTVPIEVFNAIVEIAKTNGPRVFPSAVATPDDGIKPGYKTTEFWLSLAAMLGGLALQFVPEASAASHIVGGVLSVLATFGYTHSRTVYKNTP